MQEIMQTLSFYEWNCAEKARRDNEFKYLR